VSKKPGAKEIVTPAAEAALARSVSHAAFESSRVVVPSRKVPETPPEKVEIWKREGQLDETRPLGARRTNAASPLTR
jgi:hypothetical protein